MSGRLRGWVWSFLRWVVGVRGGMGEEIVWQMFLWGKTGWIERLWKP